jgi:hypothetical protein
MVAIRLPNFSSEFHVGNDFKNPRLEIHIQNMFSEISPKIVVGKKISVGNN